MASRSVVEYILRVLDRRVAPIELLAIHEELVGAPGARDVITRYCQRAYDRWSNPMDVALRDRGLK